MRLITCFILSFLTLNVLQSQQCTGTLGVNLISNGDFGAGSANVLPAFQVDLTISDYTYTTTVPPEDGFYTVTKNISAWGSFAEIFWINIGDNSANPNGYMMVANPVQPGAIFKKNISVCAGTRYHFSVDVINLFKTDLPLQVLPNLSLHINGVAVSHFGDIPQDGQWHTLTYEFIAPSNVSNLTLSLVSNALGGSQPGRYGNDIAIDNLSFRACESRPPTLPQVVSRCNTDAFLLTPDYSGLAFPNPAYQWQRSIDGGLTWLSIPGANRDVFSVNTPVHGEQYRVLVSGSEAGLISLGCRLQSNAVTIDYRLPEVQRTERICMGESFSVGGQTFTQAGNYQAILNASVGCDTLLRLRLDVLPHKTNTVNATICQGERYQFGNDQLTTQGTYRHVFQTTTGCDSTVTLQLQVLPQVQVSQSEIICEGETYQFGNQTLTQTGTYTRTAPVAGGCDSIIQLQLTVLPTKRSTITASICEGESYTFGGQNRTTSGNYQHLLQAADGCDSIITLELTVFPKKNTHLTPAICPGATYVFDGEILTESGRYEKLFSTTNGCDSLVVIDLSVLPEVRETMQVAICPGSSYTFGGEVLTEEGSYEKIFTTVNGCDSTLTLELTIHPIFNQTILAEICEGETYQFGNQLLSEAGHYTQIFSTINGCDSVVTVELSVASTIEETISAQICSGESYSFGNESFSESGQFQKTFTAASGCDSLVTLNLTVFPVLRENLDIEICANESYTFGNESLNTSGTYEKTFQSINGCDSVVTLNLTVLPTFATSVQAQICAGETYFFGNQDRTETGSYEHTFSTINGCDSLVRLELTVAPVKTTNLSIRICEGERYALGNQFYSETGTYQQIFQTTEGCDSTVLLDLQVFPNLLTQLQATICESETYNFGNQLLTMSGTYFDTLSSVNGCDSVLALQLTVWPIYTERLDVEICEGERYTFGGENLTQSGTYPKTFSTIHGCDSLVTLHLQVHPVVTTNQYVQLCTGESYRGQLFTQSRTLIDSLQTSFGCDSIVITQVDVLPTYNNVYDLQLCPGDSFRGQPIFADTTFIFEQTTTAGCDSISTYRLAVFSVEDVVISGKPSICKGETAELRIGQHLSCQWSTGERTPSILVATPGIYHVTVTDANGCTASNSFELAMREFTADILGRDPLCFGDRNGQINFTNPQGGTAPYRYFLNDQLEQEQAVFYNLGEGNYRCRIEDSQGCQFEQDIFLTMPPELEIQLGDDISLKLGDSVRLQPFANLPLERYSWTPSDGLSCLDCPEPMARPFNSTVYFIFATSTNGCEAKASVLVEVDRRKNVYAPTAFSPNGDGINDFFTIYPANAVQIHSFSIFDRWGTLLYRTSNALPHADFLQWNGTFNGQKLPPQVFVWQAEIEFLDGERKVFAGDVLLVE